MGSYIRKLTAYDTQLTNPTRKNYGGSIMLWACFHLPKLKGWERRAFIRVAPKQDIVTLEEQQRATAQPRVPVLHGLHLYLPEEMWRDCKEVVQKQWTKTAAII
ncbi:hypothetical protein AMECASPLE_000711 [Ameca splendens]|uniref:Uncharacterized protein n=1 Tax=Ameca splendens TaxID=208324 RepID=A0ABV0X9Q4_9TELE